MKFKAKIRKIGNSLGVLIPNKVIQVITMGVNDVVELDIVITKEENIKIIAPEVITTEALVELATNVAKPTPPTYCQKKHKGRMIYARTCGCY